MKREIAGVLAIETTFVITGRGLVLVGLVTQGRISTGDIIEFTSANTVRRRLITGVEEIRKMPPQENRAGILIKCESEVEITELRNWKPKGAIGLVYKIETDFFPFELSL